MSWGSGKSPSGRVRRRSGAQSFKGWRSATLSLADVGAGQPAVDLAFLRAPVEERNGDGLIEIAVLVHRHRFADEFTVLVLCGHEAAAVGDRVAGDAAVLYIRAGAEEIDVV